MIFIGSDKRPDNLQCICITVTNVVLIPTYEKLHPVKHKMLKLIMTSNKCPCSSGDRLIPPDKPFVSCRSNKTNKRSSIGFQNVYEMNSGRHPSMEANHLDFILSQKFGYSKWRHCRLWNNLTLFSADESSSVQRPCK